MKFFDFFFHKLDISRFYGKPMHRADDSLDDESENVEGFVNEAGSSEKDSDSYESSSDQSYAEMNTSPDNDDMNEAEDQNNKPPGPAQNDWVKNVMTTSRIYRIYHFHR